MFENFNLIYVTRCLFPGLSLKSISANKTAAIQVQNSSFRNLHTFGKHKIMLKDLNFQLNPQDKDIFIKTANSEIYLDKCTFYGNSHFTTIVLMAVKFSQIMMENVNVKGVKNRNSLVQAFNSNLTMKDVYFAENHVDTGSSMILLSNRSSVFIKNSTFENNTGSLLAVRGKFNFNVQSSTFKGNTGYGIILGDCVDPPCRFSIHGSFFENNRMTGIYLRNGSLSAKECVFSHNEETAMVVSTASVDLKRCNFYWNNGVISGFRQTRISAIGCEFSHNTQVIHVESSKLDIAHCTFSWNNWTIMGFSNSNIVANVCNFTNSSGTAVISIEASGVVLTNSTFSSNKRVIFGNNSSILAKNCCFTDNNHASVIDVGESTVALTSCDYTNNNGALHGQNDSKIFMHNCHFTNNQNNRAVALISYVNQTSVVLRQCVFSQNKGVLFGDHNSSISAENSSFVGNKGATVIRTVSSHTRLTGCTFYMNDDVIFGINSSVQAIDSNFTHNTGGDPVDCDVSNVCVNNSNILPSSCKLTSNTKFPVITAIIARVQLRGCTFAENGPVISLRRNASLNVSETTFQWNGIGSTIECNGCGWIWFVHSTFSYNNPGKLYSVLQIDSSQILMDKLSVFLFLLNCTFENNRHRLFQLINANFTCTKCVFLHTTFFEEDIGDTIFVISNSQIGMNDGLFQIEPNAHFDAEISSSNMTISTTTEKGSLAFRLRSHSSLELLNSSVVGQDDSTTYMVVLSELSTLLVRNSVVHWGGMGFVACDPGIIIISNSTFYVQSMAQGNIFFRGINGFLSLNSTHIFVDHDDEEIYELRNFRNEGKPPPLNVLIELPILFYFLHSNVHLREVNLTRRVVDNASPQFSFTSAFQSSIISIDNCVFTSMAIFLLGERSTHASIVDSRFDNGSILYLYHNLDYILMDNSFLRLYTCHCCYPKTNCERPMQALRIANTTLILETSLESVKRLLTWKSMIQIGNISLNTSEENFLGKASESRMFSCSHCGVHKIDNDNLPDFSETHYAAGK